VPDNHPAQTVLQRKVTTVDPITQPNLAALRIEELLRERRPRHQAGAPWYGGRSRVTASRPARLRPDTCPRVGLPVRLRRRLGALLILAGRRLAHGAYPPLDGSAHRESAFGPGLARSMQ